MTDNLNIKVNHPKHPHNKVWKSVMQKLINGESVEVEWKNEEAEQWQMAVNPTTLAWLVGYDYREKPKVFTVSFEVPPVTTEKLSLDETYWYISSCNVLSRQKWYNDGTDLLRFQAGNVYLTKEDACKALIANLAKECNLEK